MLQSHAKILQSNKLVKIFLIGRKSMYEENKRNICHALLPWELFVMSNVLKPVMEYLFKIIAIVLWFVYPTVECFKMNTFLLLFHHLEAQNKCKKIKDSISISNGQATSSSLQPVNCGDKIKFSCNRGFNLVGSQQIVCDEDGQWSGQIPSCERKLKIHRKKLQKDSADRH